MARTLLSTGLAVMIAVAPCVANANTHASPANSSATHSSATHSTANVAARAVGRFRRLSRPQRALVVGGAAAVGWVVGRRLTAGARNAKWRRRARALSGAGAVVAAAGYVGTRFSALALEHPAMLEPGNLIKGGFVAAAAGATSWVALKLNQPRSRRETRAERREKQAERRGDSSAKTAFSLRSFRQKLRNNEALAGPAVALAMGGGAVTSLLGMVSGSIPIAVGGAAVVMVSHSLGGDLPRR